MNRKSILPCRNPDTAPVCAAAVAPSSFKMAAAASAASAAAARISGALSDAQYFESGMVRVEDIRRLLDSRSLKDKLDAMKRVVALISLGRDASIFFPDVVKNVVAPSLDVKKLVYLYLVHYAEDKQDLALLSINSFQKDISDHNQVIRALALRVLSSIRVKVILQIVILAISKCAKDPSPYVRKTAAHAIGKVTSLDNPSREILMESLALLLNDRSLEVLGSAIAVLDEIAPPAGEGPEGDAAEEDAFRLIHPHYRHICRSLGDMDPCGQVATLRFLLRYARSNFADPSPTATAATAATTRHDDLTLLLSAAHPLLHSNEPRVVMAAISIYIHLASRSEISAYITTPLMRLVLSSDPGVQYTALRAAAHFAALDPGPLLPHLSDLFVWDTDGLSVRDAKLAILTLLCEQAAAPSGLASNVNALHLLLSEFKAYMYRSDKALAAAATRALGQLAAAHPPSASAIIRLLASVVAQSTDVVVVSESVTVLRRLLQLHPAAKAHALPRLMSLLLMPADKGTPIAAAEARAAIVWLIAEFYETIPHVAPEALRILAAAFHTETSQVKLQILNLAAKVVAWEKCGLGDDGDLRGSAVSREVRLNLLSYVTACGAVDVDYDVRDKARTMRHLFLGDASETFGPKISELLFQKEKKKGLLEAKAETPAADACENASKHREALELYEGGLRTLVVLASFSHILRKQIKGCRPLRPWAVQSSPSSLRDEDPSVLRTGGSPIELQSVSSSTYHGNGAMHSMSSAMSNAMPTQVQPRSTGLAMYRPKVNVAAENFYDSDSDSDDGDASSDGSYETESESEASSSNDDAVEASEPLGADSALDMLGAMSVTPAGIGVSHPTAESRSTAPEAVRGTSDLDLFAALATNGANTSQSVASSLGNSEVARRWYCVINSVNSGGLELKVAFVRGSFMGGPDATPIVFQLSNFGRDTSGLSLRSKRISFEGGSPECHPVPQLSAGSSVETQGFCLFGGKTAAVEVQLYSGEDLIASGMVRPTPGQVLRPLPSLTMAEYGSKEKALSGMLGCKLAFTATGRQTSLATLRSRVMNSALLAEIVPSSIPPQGSTAHLRFAGFLPYGETETQENSSQRRDVLVGVEVKAFGATGGATGSIWVGCENVVYANTLGHLLKTALSVEP